MIAVLDAIPEPGKARPVSPSEEAYATAIGDPGNVGLRFLQIAVRLGEHPAFVTPSQQFSYSCLAGAALSVSCFLSSQPDFRSGSNVLLLAGNSPEYLAGFYGTLLAGGVVVPLPLAIEPARLERVRADCQATVLLISPQLVKRRTDLARAPRERIDLALGSPPSAHRLAGHRASENDLALLLYTSGSTSRPKGVMLSHRNLWANARAIREFLPIGPQDRALALLPFCHAFGNSVLQTHLLWGATLVVDGSPAFPNTIVEALQRHRANSFAGVPDLYHALLSHSDLGRLPLPDLRYLTVAGGALQPEAALQVAERIAPAQFFTMYGQTEATARLAYLPPDQLRRRPGSIGKAIAGVELQVQDASGRQVPPGGVGELCARGANVMLGYWQDQTSTSDAFRKGWLRTGDLACTDEEGFLYFRGRKTSEIKIGGLRVDLAAVLEVLNRSLPQCRLAVVPFPWNQTTRLAMFLMPGATSSLTPEQVRNICRAKLVRHEVPAYIEIVDRFSLNAALKVDLPALAQRAAKRYAMSQSATPTIGGETLNPDREDDP